METVMEAARTGNVEELKRVLRDNPVILHYVALERGENPLHMACLLGHLDFAKEMLILKPEFVKKLSPNGYSPLHMAAANGNVEIVKELIKFDPQLCHLKGKDMITPLHSAAQAGEIGVIHQILSVSPQCIQDVTIHGDTALHLALKSSQYDTLQILVDWITMLDKQEIVSLNYEQNDTLLTLAKQMKQQRALEVLLSIGSIESEERIIESYEEESSSNNNTNSYDYFKFRKGRDSPSDARTALLVIAVLVATATYQVGLSPPGGIWPDNPETEGSSSNPIAGLSILGTYDHVTFIVMIGLNSIGFAVSLSMIRMLTSGFPLRGELLVCMLALYITYGIAVNSIAPHRVRVISIVITAVLPSFVPLFILSLRKYLWPKVVTPMGHRLLHYKLLRALAHYYG